MVRVIVITSGKGGVGKTTTTANVGCALAKLGKRVVVLDADVSLRNLDLVLGLENRIVYNAFDVLNETCRLDQALVKDKRNTNLSFLPIGQSQLKSEPNTLPTEATINKRKLLYLSKDSKVIKYASDPKGMIVATINATVNKEI